MAKKFFMPDPKIFDGIRTAALRIEDPADKFTSLQHVKETVLEQQIKVEEKRKDVRGNISLPGWILSAVMFLTGGIGVVESEDKADDLFLLAIPVPALVMTGIGRLATRKYAGTISGLGGVAADAEEDIARTVQSEKAFVLKSGDLPYFMHDRADVKKIFSDATAGYRSGNTSLTASAAVSPDSPSV